MSTDYCQWMNESEWMAQNLSSRPNAHMRKCHKLKVCNIFLFHSLKQCHNLNHFHQDSLSTRQPNVCFKAVSEFYQLVFVSCSIIRRHDHQPSEISIIISKKSLRHDWVQMTKTENVNLAPFICHVSVLSEAWRSWFQFMNCVKEF